MYQQKDLYPWTPVHFSADNNKITIEVWGREYEFDNSFLPTSIITAKNKILTTPIELNAFFGDVKGTWCQQMGKKLYSSEPEAARLRRDI